MNTERGSQFYANKGGKSQFQKYLEDLGIKHVVSRKNNPQTNGKVERFWLEYAHHRWRFSPSMNSWDGIITEFTAHSA